MNNENTKEIFNYNGECSFKQFKDYIKVYIKEFPVRIPKKGIIIFTIVYFLSALVGSMIEETSIYDVLFLFIVYLIFLLLILFSVFLTIKITTRKQYKILTKQLNYKEYTLKFYGDFFIANMEDRTKKIEYTSIKKIIENKIYFYIIYNTSSVLWLKKELLNEKQKDFIRNINVGGSLKKYKNFK